MLKVDIAEAQDVLISIWMDAGHVSVIILTKGVRFTLDLVLGDEGAALNPRKDFRRLRILIYSRLKLKNYNIRTFLHIFYQIYLYYSTQITIFRANRVYDNTSKSENYFFNRLGLKISIKLHKQFFHSSDLLRQNSVKFGKNAAKQIQF